MPKPAVPIHIWLGWLYTLGTAGGKRLLAQSLSWLANEIERHPAVGNADTDALDIPTFRAGKRLRRVAPALKAAIAREAAAGVTWRTGRFALRSLARHRRHGAVPAASHLERWGTAPVVGYLEAARRCFRQRAGWLVSLDARRYPAWAQGHLGDLRVQPLG